MSLQRINELTNHEHYANPVFKRILLKISGEALMGEQNYGIDVTSPYRSPRS